jgi:hypothetical protein
MPGCWDHGDAADETSIRRILEFVRTTPPPGSRAAVRAAAAARGVSRRVAEWLALSLDLRVPAPCWDCGECHAPRLMAPPAPPGMSSLHPSLLPLHPHPPPQQQPRRWRFDPDACEALFASHLALDSWGRLFEPPPAARVHLIVGSRSRRWADAVNAERLFELQQAASFGARGVGGVRRIDAGHWAHVDAAPALRECLVEILE